MPSLTELRFGPRRSCRVLCRQSRPARASRHSLIAKAVESAPRNSRARLDRRRAGCRILASAARRRPSTDFEHRKPAGDQRDGTRTVPTPGYGGGPPAGSLGEEAIPGLAPRDGASDEEAAAAVRCLRLIGSEAADAAIDAYCDFTAPAVLEELAQVRHPLTLPAVLAAVQDRCHRWRRTSSRCENPHRRRRAARNGLTNLRKPPPRRQHQGGGPAPARSASPTCDSSSLRRTQVADVRPLERLTNLQTLDPQRHPGGGRAGRAVAEGAAESPNHCMKVDPRVEDASHLRHACVADADQSSSIGVGEGANGGAHCSAA